MRPGGAFLTLQPPNRFSNPIKNYADALGFGYGFVLGHQSGQDAFRVDLDDMLATLDLLRRHAGS